MHMMSSSEYISEYNTQYTYPCIIGVITSIQSSDHVCCERDHGDKDAAQNQGHILYYYILYIYYYLVLTD